MMAPLIRTCWNESESPTWSYLAAFWFFHDIRQPFAHAPLRISLIVQRKWVWRTYSFRPYNCRYVVGILRSCVLLGSVVHADTHWKNIARVRNCPDVTILDSLGLCIFVALPFCHVVFLSCCLFVMLSFCLFVFLSGHHCDQMSEGSRVSKVTLCVKMAHSPTKVGYRAARADKKQT